MSLFANTFLELPQFIVTKESRISQKNKFDTEYFINTIHGKLLQKYLENVLIVIVLLLTTKTYKIKIIKKFKNFIALVIATISFAIFIATN